MESPIKVAPIDQFTPLNCIALTNVGYEPKILNDAFAFKESVTEMRQRLDRTRAEAANQTAVEQKMAEPMITEECHQAALAAALVPMYASKTSNIEVTPMPDVQFVDPEKYRSFLVLNQIKETRSPLHQQVHWLRLPETQQPWTLCLLLPKPQLVPKVPNVHLTLGVYVSHWER